MKKTVSVRRQPFLLVKKYIFTFTENIEKMKMIVKVEAEGHY